MATTQSAQCRPILRYMLLTGVIKPSDLVVITAEELARAEEEAKREMLQCKPGWLTTMLANVQMNAPNPVLDPPQQEMMTE